MCPLEKKIIASLIITCLLTVPLKSDIPINTHTTNDQKNPAVAFSNGNYIVAWDSYRHSGDGDSGGIVARIFDSNCCPVTGEFLVNEITAGNQKCPDIAADANGNFVIVWQGPGIDEEDIFARRFDPNALPLADEFRVNTYTDNKQLSPRVAMNNEGKFIIVWESLDMPQPGKKAIRGQLYDRFGSKIGGELPISDQPSTCRHPAVAMDNSNEVIVVWTGGSSSNYYVYVRHFEADGNEPFLYSKKVDEENFTNLTKPSLAVDGADNYVIAWDGRCTGSDSQNIYMKRFQWTHVHLHENQFIVNTQQAGDQTNPVVAMSDDSFVVIWESDAESESNQRNIFGQRFINQGEDIGSPIPLGEEFQVNTYAVDDQKYPDVAMRENGEFVTVWQSQGQDGSEYGIFADIGPAIPCADFTGDGFVNFHDYCILAKEWLKDQSPLKTDLVDDNKINGRDLDALCEQWLRPCYDCNDVDIYTDGKIDFKDYCLWAQGYLQKGPLIGDITSNGVVDSADLQVLLFWWTQSCK